MSRTVKNIVSPCCGEPLYAFLTEATTEFGDVEAWEIVMNCSKKYCVNIWDNTGKVINV